MVRSLWSILIVMLLLTTKEVIAQDYPYPKLSGSYIRSGFTDAGKLAVSPLKWKSKQWLTFGLVAGSGLLIYASDESIRDFTLDHHTPFLNQLATYSEPFGSGLYSVPLMGGLYAVGRISKDDRLSATVLTAGKAALITGIIVQAGKYGFHRQRPYQGMPADHAHWEGPSGTWDYRSFPSGHSALVFSLAAVFASEYASTYWVPVLSYSIAAVTAFSRVYHDRHWASDVLVGSALGYVGGRYLWKLNGILQVTPLTGRDFRGLMIRMPI
jgi:membrane-associated phospholipid phosphatase